MTETEVRELLDALDFPVPCASVVPCGEPAIEVLHRQHSDTQPCDARPLCAEHASLVRAWFVRIVALGHVPACGAHGQVITAWWSPA